MTEEVPYRQVHDLLEQRGWVLLKTIKSGDELRRTYVSTRAGGPVISFPVRKRTVLRAYFEKIRSILDDFPPEEDR